MPTFSPANLELTEYVGTTGVTITINPDPVSFPMLSQTLAITNVTVNPAPSDLSISWTNNSFTFSSKFGDMFNKTYKYLIYDNATNKKTYYSVSKISQISPKLTGVYQYIPPGNDLMDVTFTISTTKADVVEAGGFTVGKTYTIVTPNDTDFTTIGAANSNAGTVFVATGSGSASTPVLTPGNASIVYNATKLVAGNTYKITALGDTDWLALGAKTAVVTADISDGLGVAGTILNVTAVTSGTIGVNTYLSGTGITPGTYVTALGSGSGGVGTYTVNTSQLVASTEVTGLAQVGTVFTSPGSGKGTGNANKIITAGYFETGKDYVIVTAGTTIFTDIGAADSNPGTIFTATASGLGTGTVTEVVTAGDFTTNSIYKILTVEDTVWTDWGSANNTVGTIFTATGNGLTENTPGTASTTAASGAAAVWTLDLRYNSSAANLALQDLTKKGSTYKTASALYPEVS